MSGKEELFEHLQTGASTTCYAWHVERKDGRSFGFTDHDNDLTFDGMVFKANSGLTAGALQKTNGMSVDNTQVSGALTDDGITELDLAAGLFDAAIVTTWLLNWKDVQQRMIRFKGTFGEIEREGGAFKVELRGLSQALNYQGGRIYQPNCAATLGDGECQFDLGRVGFSLDAALQSRGKGAIYGIKLQPDFAENWFERGRVTVLTGRATGQTATIKIDRSEDGQRELTLWIDFAVVPEAGDLLRIDAGCDKQASTCRTKFSNFLNFRGFPNMPNSDWLASYPVGNQINDGGSRQS